VMKRRHAAPPTGLWPWRPSIRSAVVVSAAMPGTIDINTVKMAKPAADAVVFIGVLGFLKLL